MEFLSDLGQLVSYNEPLARHTGFGLGGPARWFVRPRTVAELQEVIRRCGREGVPVEILGQGANLLVSDDGVDAAVIHLGGLEFRKVNWASTPDLSERQGRVNHEKVNVVVDAGVDMNRLAREAVRRGLGGLECMAGIPGSMGGIIRMNAGGRFGQIADVVCQVTVLDESGRLRSLSGNEVGFRYRGTNLNGYVVYQACLELVPGDPNKLRGRFLDILNHKKKTQPLGEDSAGCVFRNPEGHSAGELIDRAGFKGFSVGGACVSPQHANFIIAKEGAMSRDVLGLIGRIRREVAERFGVELELEIEL
ncbi:MAG: UDP-N-acetylmuramate dehydrogenase, partial [Planctomycetota bacterium]